VVGKDVPGNVLIVDQGSDSDWLLSQTLASEPAHWVSGSAPAARFQCTARTRYRQADQACEVVVADDGSLAVHFAVPQRAVTPGQSVVLYDRDECLGGAVILRTDARLERLQGSQAA
jgi:tRNA-specific 2-thiouridylase